MSLFNDIWYNWLRTINVIFSPIDKLFLSKENFTYNSYPPVFIIGPPRSGTTLLYQVIIKYFRFAYINNFAGKLYRMPNLAIRLYDKLDIKIQSNGLISLRGKTKGVAGPHEFGNFWYRWFPRRPQYADESTLNPSQKNDIFQNVMSISQYFQKSLLFKNVIHSVRIRALIDIFPKALFIVTMRDPVYTAQSIYLVRKKDKNFSDRWWSVQPRQIESIQSKPLMEQAVYQLYYILQQIYEDAVSTKPNQFNTILYENLCRDLPGQLIEIKKFFKRNGLRIERREAKLSQPKAMNIQHVSDDEFDRISTLVNELWNK